MDYSDKLENSGKSLPELLSMNTADLSSQFGMKRGHIARFMDKTRTWAAEPSPASYSLPARRQTTGPLRNTSIYRRELSSLNSRKNMTAGSTGKISQASDTSLEQSIADFKIKEGYIFKGIVSSMPAEPRACGFVQAPPVVENVAPLSAIENVSVQKITPQYKVGMERLVKTKTAPMKASEMWREKTAVLLCIRRPGSRMNPTFSVAQYPLRTSTGMHVIHQEIKRAYHHTIPTEQTALTVDFL